MEIELHPAQYKIFADESRFKVAVSGRRFGKSTLQISKLLTATLSSSAGKGIRPTVLGLLPTNPQARSVLFNPFLDLVSQYGYGSKIEVNRTLMTVDFGESYPILRFSGAHGTARERLRGLKLLHASIDEAQDIDMGFIRRVVLPALADKGGTLLATGTPKSKSDTLYQMSQSPDYTSFNYSSYANTMIPGFHDELDKLRLLIPSHEFEQEVLAQFVSKVGRFYGSFAREHVASLEYTAPYFDSYVIGFDPGALNRGWVILGQTSEKCLHLLHAEEQSELSLDSDCLLKAISQFRGLPESSRGLIMVAVDPSRPELVQTLRQQRVAGIKAYNSFEAGISTVDTMFHQRRIVVPQTSQVDGTDNEWFIDKIEGYHRKVNNAGVVLSVEDDDIETHTLDALRYAVATLAKNSRDLLGVGKALQSSVFS